MKNPIAITGIGTVCSAGPDNAAFVSALKEGRQCFSEIDESRLKGLNATHAGLINNLGSIEREPHNLSELDRNIHLALTAFRDALEDAGLSGRKLGRRSAVVMGTCSGGMLTIEKQYRRIAEGRRSSDPDELFSRRYYSAAKVLAWDAGIEGPAINIVTACAAGSGAIAQGADLIRAGLVDIAVVGGSDTFAPSTLVGFDALKATCSGICTPFSENIGLNLGEGAAFLVLESRESLNGRGAVPRAVVLGYGLSNDAYHPTAPDPSLRGQVAAMERALRDSGVEPSGLNYINAHGTGTRANDPIESKSIGRVLGDCSKNVPVSSTKSMIGHCLGAAGALEAAGSILAAEQGFLPPTAGFSEPRQGCNLEDYVPDCGRAWKGGVILSNSFGFGGNNASVVFDVGMDIDRRYARDQSREETLESTHCVITGIGVVSPFGLGIEALLTQDENCFVEGRAFNRGEGIIPCGMVPEINHRSVDRRLDLSGMDLCSSYATCASRLALTSASIKPRPREMESVGLMLGIATGPSRGEREHVTEVIEKNYKLDRLGAFPYVVPNSVAGQVSRALFLKGYNNVLACGQGAGLSAAICGTIAVELGHLETIIAASSDELSESVVLDGIDGGVWGGETNILPGEGSCAFVIESEKQAKKKNIEPLAKILGYGICTDCKDPRVGGFEALDSAAKGALENAGVAASDIDEICVSGAETLSESELNSKIFGNNIEPLKLVARIGLAEATIPLFNLSYLIARADAGAKILALSLSKEGIANALLLEKTERAI